MSTDWNIQGPCLLAALKALTSNPYVSLGDLVYAVREQEGEGWEGPMVKAWSNAVREAEAAIKHADASST